MAETRVLTLEEWRARLDAQEAAVQLRKTNTDLADKVMRVYVDYNCLAKLYRKAKGDANVLVAALVATWALMMVMAIAWVIYGGCR